MTYTLIVERCILKWLGHVLPLQTSFLGTVECQGSRMSPRIRRQKNSQVLFFVAKNISQAQVAAISKWLLNPMWRHGGIQSWEYISKSIDMQ